MLLLTPKSVPFCLTVMLIKLVQSVCRIDRKAHIADDITLSTDPERIAF